MRTYNYRSVWGLLLLFALGGAAALSGPEQAFAMLALDPAAVRAGEVWRLVTFPFLTYGLVGLLFKLMVFYYIAAPLESVWGTRRFLTLFMISVLGTSLTATALNAVLAANTWAPQVPTLTLMLIHGFMFPDSTLYVMLVMPMRVKTIALLTTAVFLAACVASGIAGIALFAGMMSGAVYYMATTRSIPWIRRKRRRMFQAIHDHGSLTRSVAAPNVMKRAREIMKKCDTGGRLDEQEQAFLENLLQQSDREIELCSPYSFCPENEHCPPCKAFGRCLRRYLDESRVENEADAGKIRST